MVKNKTLKDAGLIYEGDQACFYFYSPRKSEEAQGLITRAEVIRGVVASHYLVSLKDINKKCRKQRYVTPRQTAMYLCRELTDYSLPDIAEAFERTHSDVIHAIKAVKNRIETEPSFGGLIERLSKKAVEKIEEKRRV